jgi:LEA14-like dessication related protein
VGFVLAGVRIPSPAPSKLIWTKLLLLDLPMNRIDLDFPILLGFLLLCWCKNNTFYDHGNYSLLKLFLLQLLLVSTMVAGKIVAAAVILIVLVAVAGLGIYYYDAYHKLTFQLKSISLGSVSLSSVQTNFGIAIGNPSQLPIYIPSANFDIYVNDQYLGKGSFGALTIGGNSQSQISVPVTFSTADVSSVLIGLITGGGSVTVTIQGSANLVLLSIPFNTTLYDASFT